MDPGRGVASSEIVDRIWAWRDVHFSRDRGRSFHQILRWICEPQSTHNHGETRHHLNPWPSLILLFSCFSKRFRQSYDLVVSSWTKCGFFLVGRGSCLFWVLRNLIAQQAQSFLHSAELWRSDPHSLCGGLYTEAPGERAGPTPPQLLTLPLVVPSIRARLGRPLGLSPGIWRDQDKGWSLDFWAEVISEGGIIA